MHLSVQSMGIGDERKREHKQQKAPPPPHPRTQCMFSFFQLFFSFWFVRSVFPFSHRIRLAVGAHTSFTSHAMMIGWYRRRCGARARRTFCLFYFPNCSPSMHRTHTMHVFEHKTRKKDGIDFCICILCFFA